MAEFAINTVVETDASVRSTKRLRDELDKVGPGAEGSFKKAQGGSEQFAKSLGLTEQKLRDLQSGLTTAGAGLTAVGAAGAAAFGLLANSAIQFESGFAGVQKTLDATPETFARIRGEIIELSTTIPATTAELNKVAEIGGQLGIEANNVLAFTETIVKLGAASNVTGEEGATMLARFANVTQVGQDKFEQLASVIVDLGNNSATTEAEILGMATRMGGAGRVAGIQAPEILAFAAALSSAGVEAEAGGTNFSLFAQAMTSAVQTGGDELTKFAAVAGVSAEEFRRVFQEDAGDAIRLFVTGLSNIEKQGGPVFQVLEDMELSGARMSRTLLALGGSTDLVEESTRRANEQWANATALTEEFERRAATTESQIQLVKNGVNALAIELGDTLLPDIRAATQAASDFIQQLRDFNREHPQVVAALGRIAAAVTVLAGGAGFFALAAAGALKFGETLAKLRISMVALGTARTGVIGGMVVAFTAWAVAFKKLLDASQDFGRSIGATLLSAVLDIKPEFLDTAKNLDTMNRNIETTTGQVPGFVRELRAQAEALEANNTEFTKPGGANENLDTFGQKAEEAAGKLQTLRFNLDEAKKAAEQYDRVGVILNQELDRFNTEIRRAVEADAAPKLTTEARENAIALDRVNAAANAANIGLDSLKNPIDETTRKMFEAKQETGFWEGALKQVSTVITDLGKDLARVFTEPGSIGEKVVGALNAMKEAIIRLVAEQVMGLLLQQLGKLIALLPGLNNFKDTIEGIFGVSQSAQAAARTAQTTTEAVQATAETAEGVSGAVKAGTAGGAAGGGAAGGALGSASAVAGFINAAANVGSFIKSFEIETGLDAIEENTRALNFNFGPASIGGILDEIKQAVLFGDNTKANELAAALLNDMQPGVVRTALQNIEVSNAGILAALTGGGIVVAGGAPIQSIATTSAAAASTLAEMEPQLGEALKFPAQLGEALKFPVQAGDGARAVPFRGRAIPGELLTEPQLGEALKFPAQLGDALKRFPDDLAEVADRPLPPRARRAVEQASEQAAAIVSDDFTTILESLPAEAQDLFRRNPLAFLASGRNPLTSLTLGGFRATDFFPTDVLDKKLDEFRQATEDTSGVFGENIETQTAALREDLAHLNEMDETLQRQESLLREQLTAAATKEEQQQIAQKLDNIESRLRELKEQRQTIIVQLEQSEAGLTPAVVARRPSRQRVLPSLQGGGFIEQSGVAFVHRGERVLPPNTATVSVNFAPTINVSGGGTGTANSVAAVTRRMVRNDLIPLLREELRKNAGGLRAAVAGI